MLRDEIEMVNEAHRLLQSRVHESASHSIVVQRIKSAY